MLIQEDEKLILGDYTDNYEKKVVLLITNGIGCLISASGYFPKPSFFFKSSSSKHRITGQFQISNSKGGSHYRKNMPKSYCLFVCLFGCTVCGILISDQGSSSCSLLWKLGVFFFLIYFWLHWVFVTAHKLSLVGYSVVSLVVEHRL